MLATAWCGPGHCSTWQGCGGTRGAAPGQQLWLVTGHAAQPYPKIATEPPDMSGYVWWKEQGLAEPEYTIHLDYFSEL